jgi:hypothetical protein
MERRGFLKLCLATSMAPAIVRASSLMKVSGFSMENGVLVPKVGALWRGNWMNPNGRGTLYYEGATKMLYHSIDNSVYASKTKTSGFGGRFAIWDKVPNPSALNFSNWLSTIYKE